MPINNDNKDIINFFTSSIKERNFMLRDLLMEMRKMHSMSMDKMLGMINKMKKSDNNSMMVKAIREQTKINQSMMNSLITMAKKKESDYKENMESMLKTSNSLMEAIKKMASQKLENKTVIVRSMNNKSIDNLTDAIKNGALKTRERWIPSAS